jgi:hypothetical protein
MGGVIVDSKSDIFTGLGLRSYEIDLDSEHVALTYSAEVGSMNRNFVIVRIKWEGSEEGVSEIERKILEAKGKYKANAAA